MRSKNAIICTLLVVVLLVGVSYERGLAAAKKEIQPAKIAVVSVMAILENSKKNLKWQQGMQAERDRIISELDKQEKELVAIKADMETRKVGSGDYLNLVRQAMEKQATLEATEKFHQQDFSIKQQQWTEQLYQEILVAIEKVAKEKGLDVVLAKEEYQFPSATTNDLVLTIKTSKVLYSGEEMDITSDVLTVIDN